MVGSVHNAVEESRLDEVRKEAVIGHLIAVIHSRRRTEGTSWDSAPSTARSAYSLLTKWSKTGDSHDPAVGPKSLTKAKHT